MSMFLLNLAQEISESVSYSILGLLFLLVFILIQKAEKRIEETKGNKEKSENKASNTTTTKKRKETKLELLKKSEIAKQERIPQKELSIIYLDYLKTQAKRGMEDEGVIVNESKMTSSNDSLAKCEIEYSVLPKITVVYATQSNTSKTFAENIKKDCKEKKIKVEVKNISDIEKSDFESNILLVFLVATYGEGEPTDDAIEFYKKIKSDFLKGAKTENLRYCIFGLGSRKYEKFNQSAKVLNTYLQKNGIKEMLDLFLGDDAINIRNDFEIWKRQFYKSLTTEFLTKKNLIKLEDFIKKNNLTKLNEEEKEFEIVLSELREISKEGFSVEEKDYEYSIRNFLKSSECELENITQLRQSTKNGSTLKAEYNLPESFSYETGDNIGIFPSNNESDIEFIMKYLNFDPESFVHIVKHKQKLSKKVNIPDKMKVREIMSYIVDLNGKLR